MGVLQVRRALVRLPTQMGKDRGDLYIEAEPKTKSSRRSVVIAGFALEALKQHHIRQEEMSLLSMGVHPKVVQKILGHSEISMTMDIYSHVLPTMQKDAMDKH